jgi:ribosomal protein L37AE/L43A
MPCPNCGKSMGAMVNESGRAIWVCSGCSYSQLM